MCSFCPIWSNFPVKTAIFFWGTKVAGNATLKVPDLNERDLMTDEGLFVFRCGKKRLLSISNEIPCFFSCLSDYCGAAATLKFWFYAKIHFAPQKQDKSNLYFLCLLHFTGGFSNSLIEHSEAIKAWWCLADASHRLVETSSSLLSPLWLCENKNWHFLNSSSSSSCF